MNELTPEQIENWRKVLLRQIGPYALIMPVEDIRRYREMFQAMAETKRPERKGKK